MNPLLEDVPKDIDTQILDAQEEILKKLLIIEALVHSENYGIPQMRKYVLADFETIFGIKSQPKNQETVLYIIVKDFLFLFLSSFPSSSFFLLLFLLLLLNK